MVRLRLVVALMVLVAALCAVTANGSLTSDQSWVVVGPSSVLAEQPVAEAFVEVDDNAEVAFENENEHELDDTNEHDAETEADAEQDEEAEFDAEDDAEAEDTVEEDAESDESAEVEAEEEEQPVLLESSASHEDDSLAEVETEILAPYIQRADDRIAANTATLAQMELLSHQLGARVLSDLAADASAHEVEHIEHALQAHAQPTSLAGVETLEAPTALLEQAPVAEAQAADEATADLESELNMVELESTFSAPDASAAAAAPAAKKHDYAFLDDPIHGGAPTSLTNLKGLDIYVVNTPVANDNDNEIRPVRPPNPQSSAAREKARLAAIMRAELVHDIPQPKASVQPTMRINPMSAYESSLVDPTPIDQDVAPATNGNSQAAGAGSSATAVGATPVRKRLAKHFGGPLADPLVGGMGALPLPSIRMPPPARFQQLDVDAAAEEELPGTAASPASARFQQLESGPVDPNAVTVARAAGAGSSFDMRDGPPVLLDDILPLKAHLVESLNPI